MPRSFWPARTREPALDRYWVPSVASSAVFGTQICDDYFPVAPGGDGEMHVTAATVAELLSTRRPQSESGVVVQGQPNPVRLRRDHFEAEHLDVEAGQAVGIVGLQGQLR